MSLNLKCCSDSLVDRASCISDVQWKEKKAASNGRCISQSLNTAGEAGQTEHGTEKDQRKVYLQHLPPGGARQTDSTP